MTQTKDRFVSTRAQNVAGEQKNDARDRESALQFFCPRSLLGGCWLPMQLPRSATNIEEALMLAPQSQRASLGAVNGYCGTPRGAKPAREQRPDNCLVGTRSIDKWPGMGKDDIHDIKCGVNAGPTDWVASAGW